MRSVTPGDLQRLLDAHAAPCVSIYLPTPRTYPDNRHNALRFRGLLDRADEQLTRQYPGEVSRPVREKFARLLADETWWAHPRDGVAVLAAPDYFDAFGVQRPVPERVCVAESFYVKPLLRIVQSADRFQVLCLTRDRARLLEGNRDALDESTRPGIPRTAEEALGAVLLPTASELPKRPAMGDNVKRETERFFRAVDRAVYEHASNQAKLPLVLVALPEHQGMFRELSHNPHLLPRGVDQNPDALTPDQLRQAVWQQVLPNYLGRLEKLTEDYRTAAAQGQGTDDLMRAADAARNGRVGILLVDADRHVPGSLDPVTGRPHPTPTTSGDTNDLLDDLAEQVLRTSGTVIVVPQERMPTDTGLAAIYRY